MQKIFKATVGLICVAIMCMTLSLVAFAENYGNNVITDNGQFFVAALAGDANIDGYTDIKDLVRIKKYLVDNSAEIDIEAVDFDSNEDIDAIDLAQLKQLLLGAI